MIERLNILVACEESGKVRDAFRMRGHNAFSCDLQPARTPSWHHIYGSVLPILHLPWDVVIAFPPCTDLCSSGAAWFAAKRADGRQQASVEFFKTFTPERLEHVPYISIENPVGIMSKQYRKPDQIIQPWQFGHAETKATCLWLHGLPKLTPTMVVQPDYMKRPDGTYYVGKKGVKYSRIHFCSRKDRAKVRSETFDGIADAMADQWSTYLAEQSHPCGGTRRSFEHALDAFIAACPHNRTPSYLLRCCEERNV